MKNKKMMFVLLPAVILIWGLIIYRIVDSMHDKDLPSIIHDSSIKPKSSVISLPDTTYLLINYRDPFLGAGVVISQKSEHIPVATHPVSVKSIQTPAPTTPKVIIAWPSIKYVGMIQNGSSNVKIAILKINGKSHLIAEDASAEQIMVQKIVQDSVGLLFQGEQKYFRK